MFKRAIVSHISEAADLHHSGNKAHAVVNCTGLSSRSLGGVMDTTLLPARGQIVLVRNDPGLMASISGTDDGDDEATYIMTRAVGMLCFHPFDSKIPYLSPSLNKYRRRHNPRRILPKEQLGSKPRPKPSHSNHETMHRAMPKSGR